MLDRLRLGRWTGKSQKTGQDKSLATAPSLIPNRRRFAIAGAREVMIVLGDRLPADVEEWLSERKKPGSVEVLCGDFPDAVYLLGLLEKGYLLFDAVVPQQTLIFLDRQQCYRLPDWDPVPDAFSLACDLLWRRNGCYARLVGLVTEIAPGGRMFKLLVNEHYWTWVTVPTEGTIDCHVPAIDSRVKVLGISSWIGGVAAHLIHGVLIVSLGEA